ncbi:SCO family protein [Phenylobacterium sp.]|jgi:protein SCO1/2|uniref:SCO family protein n=1 Tax=Phenylobacterium sp. TaxID=1871053 RepID=UPI0037CB27BC
MSRRILALIAVLALALAGLAGLAARQLMSDDASQASVGGPFELIDTSGATVNQDVLKGKWSVVFFGFTQCPDICPTTLFELGQVETLLGPRADKVQAVLISVDPDRDTPRQMAAYVANPSFPKRLIALTGSAAQVDRAAKAYRVFYQKVGEGPDYTVNHASYSYLMTPRGRLACVLPYDLTPEQTAARIQAAMAKGPRADSC